MLRDGDQEGPGIRQPEGNVRVAPSYSEERALHSLVLVLGEGWGPPNCVLSSPH